MQNTILEGLLFSHYNLKSNGYYNRELIYCKLKLKKIRIFFTNIVSLCFIYIFSKIEGIQYRQNKLLCVNTEKLGDLVLASDFLFSIGNSKNYDQCFIIIAEQYSNLFNWTKLGFVPIYLSKKKYKFNIFYRVKFILKIKKMGITTAINFTPERGWINDELVLSISAKEKITFKSRSVYLLKTIIKNNNKRYSSIYNNDDMNEYSILKKYLIEEKITLSFSKTIFNCSESTSRIGENLIKGKYICIAPFASDLGRTWAANNYKNLINSLTPKVKVIILGKEIELSEFNKGIKQNSNLISEMVFGLPEVINIIANSTLFIGNDSGLTHIAHNLKVSTIALIGGGDYGRFFPYKDNINTYYFYHKLECFNCHWNCIYKERFCLTEINFNDVLNKIYEIVKL